MPVSCRLNPIQPLSADERRQLTHGHDGANPISRYYQQFQVHSRILLTGHSHQAWPDCAREGVLAAFTDAACHVDDKWQRAEEQAEAVRAGFAQRLGDPDGQYVLGQNVHELGLRWLSSLPAYSTSEGLRHGLPILTTSEEFHSLRRQLDRLSEYGIAIHKEPMGLDIAARLAERVADPAKRFGAVVVSAVSYKQGVWLKGFGELAKACAAADVPLLIDAYHAVNVLPWSVEEQGLGTAFVVGGGYKYCQLGEGNCFLRLPEGHSGRPAITGWFADVPNLGHASSQSVQQVAYPDGAASFAGSTYDPTSHYRAAAVFGFFDALGLDVALLRQVSQRQIARLRQGIAALGLPDGQLSFASHEGRDDVAEEQRAGFLALRVPGAPDWAKALRKKDVWCDARESTLRFGPAPYVSDSQLDLAVNAIGATAQELRR